jgi:hypothetical protein
MRSTKGFEEERKRGQIGVGPVRLDETVMKTDEAWAAKLRARLSGDFRSWKDHDVYRLPNNRMPHHGIVDDPVGWQHSRIMTRRTSC